MGGCTAPAGTICPPQEGTSLGDGNLTAPPSDDQGARVLYGAKWASGTLVTLSATTPVTADEFPEPQFSGSLSGQAVDCRQGPLFILRDCAVCIQ